MIKFAISFLLVTCVSIQSLANSRCEVIVSTPPMSEVLGKRPFSQTQKLTHYLTELLERGNIGPEDLSGFEEALIQGSVINPLENSQLAGSTLHFKEVQKYIESGNLDLEELLIWVREVMVKIRRDSNKRSEVEGDTENFYSKMKWNRIEPGSLEVSEYDKTFTLTNPFEMMTTPVTQAQWIEIMGENPSGNKGGKDSLKLEFNGRFHTLRPDNPIENIDFFQILEFANRLSEQHGLKPVYNLEAVKLKRGSDGRITSLGGQWIILNNDDQDIYATEGYRLPTVAEWLFVSRGRGKYSPEDLYNMYVRGEQSGKPFLWDKGNSGHTTHPVGETSPLMVEGMPFYELFGNVQELTNDSKDLKLRGVNPCNILSDQGRAAVGGSFSIAAESGSHFDCRRYVPEFNEYTGVGFRLVRTLEVRK